MNLTGNTILITGGTSGIGLALAETFHARGNTVIIAGRRKRLLDEIIAKHPGMIGMALDIDDPAAIGTFARDIRAQFPALNVLINNAGISRPENLQTGVSDLGTAEAIVLTNILGVLRMTAELMPQLVSQPASTIITTTSGLAFVPRAPYPTYCASKAFLHTWLLSLRAQLRDTPVEVLELVPPYVQTELAGAAQATDPHAMPLADYINEVITLLESGDLPGGEILVKRVLHLRQAAEKGEFDQVFRTMNG